MDRRMFLTNAPAALTATALPAVAATETPKSAAYHLAEFKRLLGRELGPGELAVFSSNTAEGQIEQVSEYLDQLQDGGPVDPLVWLWSERERLLAAWYSEINSDPKAGNFDTPECLRLERARTEVEKALSTTVATSPAGLAAQLEFAIKENWAPNESGFGVTLFATMLAGARGIS